MIVVIHSQQKLVKLSIDGRVEVSFDGEWITTVIPQLAELYPNQLLIWCHEKAEQNVAWSSLELLFDQDRKMLSYFPKHNFFPDSLGYVEDSIFIKVNKKVTFPTWQMSSYIGGMATSILRQIDIQIWKTKNFDFVLNSIAKTYQSQGLFCYSEPKLLVDNKSLQLDSIQANIATLFVFVKLHYKSVWCLLLFLNVLIYERKLTLWSWFKTILVTKKKCSNEITFDAVLTNSIDLSSQTIDVILPTIGRKSFLYDFLKDLSMQTHLPQKVIIVEQNPTKGSQTELDFITSEEWPFQINHIFTHQTGACQARNKALELVESDWVFLADDDIRIEEDFNEKALLNIFQTDSKAVTFSCLRKDELKIYITKFSWSTFGSGCSFVHSSLIENIFFDTKFEYGFGEDADFGMQIRNKGYDIIYLPKPTILHLKAPIGGFRTKPVLEWHSEKIAPKPSPTIMLFNLLYKTREQLLGYKTILFLKYYKVQSIKNPLAYYKYFQKQWQVSLKWAKILQERNEF
jgi:glycosyltransferase involved in cell wall biosynthesis